MCFAVLISTLVFMVSSVVFLRRKVDIIFPYRDLVKILFGGFVSFLFMYILSLYTNNILMNIVIGSIGFLIYGVILVFLRFYNDYDFEIAENLVSKVPFLKKYGMKILKCFKKKYITNYKKHLFNIFFI